MQGSQAAIAEAVWCDVQNAHDVSFPLPCPWLTRWLQGDDSPETGSLELVVTCARRFHQLLNLSGRITQFASLCWAVQIC